MYGLNSPPDITEQTAELLIPSSKFSENMNGLITGAAVFDRISCMKNKTKQKNNLYII